MALPTTLTMRQWERRRITSSVKTQSGSILEAGPGIGVDWRCAVDTPGIVGIFPIPDSFDAELVAIGPSNARLVTIIESVFGVDPAMPGAQYNKVVRNYPITLNVTSDPLQTPDGSFVAE